MYLFKQTFEYFALGTCSPCTIWNTIQLLNNERGGDNHRYPKKVTLCISFFSSSVLLFKMW